MTDTAEGEIPQDWISRFPELPVTCGNVGAAGLVSSADFRDWSCAGTTEDQLRMEQYIAGFDLHDAAVLHVGIGNSGLARRFHRIVGTIVGTTVDQAELYRASSLGFPNYVPVLQNKYEPYPLELSGGFRFILDNNLTSSCCCLTHLQRMLVFYRDNLAPGGGLLTDLAGLRWVPSDPRAHAGFSFDLSSLRAVAKSVGLEAFPVGRQTIVLRREGEQPPSQGDATLRAMRQFQSLPGRAISRLEMHARAIVRRARVGVGNFLAGTR